MANNSKPNNISQDSIKKLNDFSIFFEKYFCFSELEIKELVDRVLSENDNELVLRLLDLFEAFINQDIEDFNPEERNTIAKRAVNYALDLYTSEKNKNFDEIIKILNHAKQFGTDPFKLVKKTILRNATFDSYSHCIEALKTHIYTDKIFNSEFTIINENQDINEFLEDCSSVICKLSADSVQNVLDVLGEFFYDKDLNKYILNPKDAVKQVKTLLITSPSKLEENINYYMSTFSSAVPESKIKLAIANSPSALILSQSSINEFLQQYKLSIDSLITLSNKNPRFSGQKITAKDLARLFHSDIPLTNEDIENSSENYQAFLDNAAKKFCIENLSNIANLGRDKISTIFDLKDIFIEPFGIKNALFCLQDFNFLNADKDLLDYMFSLVMESEKAGHKNLREYILRHSSKSVRLASHLKSLQGDEPAKKIIDDFVKTYKGKKQIFNLPKITNTNIAAKREKLTEAQLKTAKRLLDQIIDNSRNSDDLDIELINKLSELNESFIPVLAMCQRAEVALRHNGSNESKNTAIQVSKFITSYESYLSSLTRLNKQYEECKSYYEGKEFLPKFNNPIGSKLYTYSDGSFTNYSVEDCYETMEERADQTYNDSLNIKKFYTKVSNFSREAARNPLSDKKYYEAPLTKLLGNECNILKSEAITLSVINRIAEELNKVYPNKALEILGEENYSKYLDMPIPTTRLLSYILVVCRNNSGFLIVVRKQNDFKDIEVPKAEFKAKFPTLYDRILRARKFENSYLEIENILQHNFSGRGNSYDVSGDYRSIQRVPDKICFLCPRVDDNDALSNVDIEIENSYANEKVYPLSARGIRKLLGQNEKILSDENLQEKTIEKFAKLLN